MLSVKIYNRLSGMVNIPYSVQRTLNARGMVEVQMSEKDVAALKASPLCRSKSIDVVVFEEAIVGTLVVEAPAPEPLVEVVEVPALVAQGPSAEEIAAAAAALKALEDAETERKSAELIAAALASKPVEEAPSAPKTKSSKKGKKD